jgi:hypothetical protein
MKMCLVRQSKYKYQLCIQMTLTWTYIHTYTIMVQRNNFVKDWISTEYKLCSILIKSFWINLSSSRMQQETLNGFRQGKGHLQAYHLKGAWPHLERAEAELKNYTTFASSIIRKKSKVSSHTKWMNWTHEWLWHTSPNSCSKSLYCPKNL